MIVLVKEMQLYHYVHDRDAITNRAMEVRTRVCKEAVVVVSCV